LVKNLVILLFLVERQIRSMSNIDLNKTDNNRYDYVIIVRKEYFNNTFLGNKLILLKYIK